MNSDVHRHQAHPPLAQHLVGGSLGPCGWYTSPPAPTAPARLKRHPPTNHIQSSAGAVVTNGPLAVSPTTMQNNVPQHNPAVSGVRPAAPSGLHVSLTTASSKGATDVVINTTCQQNNGQAVQPGNRLASMSHMPWHHGSISRERAESLLAGSGDGVFLVRESTNFPGDHTLCVRYRGRVEHYRVKWATPPGSQTQQLTIDDEEFFYNMTDLIHHYLQDADGLCTQLVRCLPKATNPLQPPFPPHPQQPPPYPPTPAVTFSHSHTHAQRDSHTHSQDQPDAAINPHQFVDARWIIPERDLEIKENIGKGEFGEVMLGILRGTEKVAVKILKDKEAATKFRAEASVMAALEHENLVRLLGLVWSGGCTCIVTEYCEQGALEAYLRSRGRHYITQLHQINFAYDTCLGMEYLERMRVVHRDLAARNVLIAADGTAKVADFGLARTGGDRGPSDQPDTITPKLPIKWTAPEALKYNKFSNKSDMWSFGILLWEIYSFGRIPYTKISMDAVVRDLERGYRLEAPEGCPPGPYEVMRSAWNKDPALRPTFAQTRPRLAHIREQTLAMEHNNPAQVVLAVSGMDVTATVHATLYINSSCKGTTHETWLLTKGVSMND